MAAKTFGGYIITKYGIRAWWRIQRLLIAWGTGAVELGRAPTHREVATIAYKNSAATLHHDMESFRLVFPGRTPFEVWTELYDAREVRRAGVVDVVQHAMWLGAS
jgi:hypothetical protein